MPKLILLNGPPAVGKSTLARIYVDRHPLALNLDVDRIRGMIGRWRDDPTAAGLLARSITLAAARTHLMSGHDVVVPQYLGRLTFIEQLEGLAAEVDASFQEIVLLDDRERLLRRFAERSRLAGFAGSAADPSHVDARDLLDATGGVAELAAMHDRLVELLATRPRARIIRTIEGRPEQAYRELSAWLS